MSVMDDRLTGLARGGAVAAVGLAVAAGAAVGLALENRVSGRLLGRRRPEIPVHPYGSLRGEIHEVIADDGIRIHVEVDEPHTPEHPAAIDGLTVVFIHGYALQRAEWHHQRLALRDVARVVVYDQRSHGMSERASAETHRIEQLGRDLRHVLDAVAPTGPVILVGHSMGGMTIMALADAHPELFGSRIRGVGLLSTSAGQLAEVPLGLPHIVSRVTRPLVPQVAATMVAQKDLIERTRRAANDLAMLLTRRYSFASEVSQDTVEFVTSMLAATPIDVVAEFLPTFDEHEATHALSVMQQVDTLVLVGERDLLTPVEHSHAIVRQIPGAELVLVPQAGHMVQLERPALVNGHLQALVTRVRRDVASHAVI